MATQDLIRKWAVAHVELDTEYGRGHTETGSVVAVDLVTWGIGWATTAKRTSSDSVHTCELLEAAA